VFAGLLSEAGLRKGEARRLQLRDVDVEQSRLVILEGNGGKDRVIPIRSANPHGQAGRGAERIRTAVRGFAGPCLTSRPRRQPGQS
jgi:integrase